MQSQQHADGTCTAKLTSVGGSGLSHRNIIINGAHERGQYGTSASNTGGTSARSVDRFFAKYASACKHLVKRLMLQVQDFTLILGFRKAFA